MSTKLGFKKALVKSQAAAKKKAVSIFSAMSVAHVDDEEPVTGEVRTVEKVLPNGEFYSGQCCDGLPYGQGKYLWNDGCMYVGEWSKGNTTGIGMFSWPCGATYEGDFKAGFMDGNGTYTSSSGDAYKGSWSMNFRQGQGTQSYANGDCYEGEWSKGCQNGRGKYQWENGNNYSGQWRNGMMNGNGTMVWLNGNWYDGYWEDGFPSGNGKFRWADGSFYVGFWSKVADEQSGTYYPSGSPAEDLDWDPQQVFLEDLKDCKICSTEEVSIFPSHKKPHSPGSGKWSDRRPRRTSERRLSNYSWNSDTNELSSNSEGDSRDGNEGFHSEDSDVRASFSHFKVPVKKQGQTISKGHKNYELMLNLQLGIRHSIGRPGPAISLDLKSSAFDPNEKLWTKFPPEGSKHTPPHQSCDFRWKDYCPIVFRTLRKLFNVDAADYMMSICGNDALRELSSPGKSGSFFYLTNDDRYMIKTMKKAEVKVLLRMLPAYYDHVKSCRNTLVTKFYGLHCVRLTGAAQKKVRFVIMGNLFCSEYTIHRRFDLKGSSHGRTTAKSESEIDPTTTLKDLDLNYIFRLQKLWFPEFYEQVDRDCDFLEQERIMDYSMLIGFHFREVSSPSTSGAHTPIGDGNSDGYQFQFDSPSVSSISLGINMPARIEKTVRSDCETQLVGEPTGELYEVILFFGIIDILQDYDISKKLEHAYKSMHYDPTSISAVDPKQYSKRFRDFIFKVFVEDT